MTAASLVAAVADRPVRVGACQHHEHVRSCAEGAPRLHTVDDVAGLAVGAGGLGGGDLDAGHVAAVVGLRHCDGRHDLRGREEGQPVLLLRLGPVLHQGGQHWRIVHADHGGKTTITHGQFDLRQAAAEEHAVFGHFQVSLDDAEQVVRGHRGIDRHVGVGVHGHRHAVHLLHVAGQHAQGKPLDIGAFAVARIAMRDSTGDTNPPGTCVSGGATSPSAVRRRSSA